MWSRSRRPRDIPRQVSEAVADMASGPAPTPNRAWRALAKAGLFDVGFYGAQVGVDFTEPAAAGEHFMAGPMQAGVSPHPLLDVTMLPPRQQQNWREGRLRRVVTYLGRRGLHGPWSYLFDPALLLDAAGLAEADEDDRWSYVRRWLSELTPTTVLPTTAGITRSVTWSEAREELVARAREITAATALLRPRMSDEWDEAAERRWLDAVEAVRLAAASGPLVSVVMPVWNRVDRVADAVRAVQAQTLDRWELIVVDDGSTDGTAEHLDQFAAADDRIHVVRAPHGGVCRARNAGLEQARGRYVAFLDSDNTWRPHYLDTALRAMTRDGLRLAYAAASLRAGDRVRYLAFEGGREHLMVFNHVDLNVLVIDADLAREVGGFDPEMRRWVDHDYVLRAAKLVEPRLLPFIGCDYDNDDTAQDRITLSESNHWQFVALGKAWVDWDSLAATLAQRVVGRTSVVIPTYQDVRLTEAAVASVLSTTTSEDDIEIVVVDNGSAASVSLALASAFVGVPDVRLLRLPRNLNFGIGSNVGVACSTGKTVLFLNNDTRVRPGWLEPLRRRLDGPTTRGVQPLLVYPDDTVQACGTVFPVADGLPVHLIAGHPREDAAAVDGMGFEAVTAAATLYRAEELVALRGFDPIFVNGMEDVDLCLRAIARFGGSFAVTTDAVVEHHESKTPGRGRNIEENRRIFLERWRGRLPGPQDDAYAAVGFRIVQMGLDRQPYAAPRPVLARSAQTTRWSIKCPAPAGPDGDLSDAAVLCARLADALRAQGQEVVVVREGAHDGPASVFDDVVLAVRGESRVNAQPGRLSVLVTMVDGADLPADEAVGFARVLSLPQLGMTPKDQAGALVDIVSELPG